jgi:molecular chaperone HtpG
MMRIRAATVCGPIVAHLGDERPSNALSPIARRVSLAASPSGEEPMTERAEHEIRFEIEGLISLLAQNLYADPDVFLREMVQNAHDSIIKRRELAVVVARGETPAQLPRPEIRIEVDRAARTLSIVDDGAGLTEREMHEHLSTIGASGTRELKRTLADRDRTRTVDLIGQFGIGLLSAYIVAARVEITTRSAVEPALRWSSDGGKRYHVEPAERADVGTTVVLHLRTEHGRYLELDRLRGIVRRYADFIGIPVLVDGVGGLAADAPWHKAYAGDADRRRRGRGCR